MLRCADLLSHPSVFLRTLCTVCPSRQLLMSDICMCFMLNMHEDDVTSSCRCDHACKQKLCWLVESPLHQVDWVFVAVCLSVCLSVCLLAELLGNLQANIGVTEDIHHRSVACARVNKWSRFSIKKSHKIEAVRGCQWLPKTDWWLRVGLNGHKAFSVFVKCDFNPKLSLQIRGGSKGVKGNSPLVWLPYWPPNEIFGE